MFLIVNVQVIFRPEFVAVEIFFISNFICLNTAVQEVITITLEDMNALKLCDTRQGTTTF
jgi:hypothetical protein